MINFIYNSSLCSFLNLKFWFLVSKRELVRENNRKYDRKYNRKYDQKIRSNEIRNKLLPLLFGTLKKCVIHFLKESLRSAAPTLSHKLSKTLILTHAQVVRSVKRRHTNFLNSRMRTFENVKFRKRSYISRMNKVEFRIFIYHMKSYKVVWDKLARQWRIGSWLGYPVTRRHPVHRRIVLIS